ncbi:E3 ubiquitin-protein ligase [Aspergillus lucknowensis]|uniref:RBR-type E3 ubiquitin transferase n=1 Tax=Aspergillus lucknowensis TaxID=176173 RepID=A0ABR4M0X7_9EURO
MDRFPFSLLAKKSSSEDGMDDLTQRLKTLDCSSRQTYYPPPNRYAVSSLRDEVVPRLGILNNQKPAQIIAHAVESAYETIASIAQAAAPDRVGRSQTIAAGVGDHKLQSSRTSDMKPGRSGSVHPAAMRLKESDQPIGNNRIKRKTEAAPYKQSTPRREDRIRNELGSKAECCVCYDWLPPGDIRCLDCKHLNCRRCLRNLFRLSTTDESVFPPKCCGVRIPLSFVQEELSSYELRLFREAEVEFSTTDRTYCSNPSCRKFIPPRDISATRATCSYCAFRTCPLCKNAYHRFEACAADPSLQATLELGARKGWQRCFSCRALVERRSGCHHIKCICGAEFCYICGQKWRTCECGTG